MKPARHLRRSVALFSSVGLLCTALAVACSSGGTGAGPGPTAGAAGTAGTTSAGSAGATPGGAGASGSNAGSAGAYAGAGGNAGSSAGSGGMSAGGNAGAGGATTAMWTNNGSKYSLSFGNTYFEVDAALGGRITSFKTGGKELLADAATTQLDFYWGSTFWPSPQKLFNLPPTDDSISNIDRNPYAAKLEGDVLTLTSEPNKAAPKLVVTKTFSADVAKEAIVIRYQMKNVGTAELSVAPWEVTRVAGGGITFYPELTVPYLKDNALVLPPTTLAGGARWFQHDVSVTKPTKFFADGKDGWVAHAAADTLLIKTFPDIKGIPNGMTDPSEDEIEIYAVPTYVEVEQQGALEKLAAGASSTAWTVRWYARKLAAPATVGSADLVTYVQNQIK